METGIENYHRSGIGHSGCTGDYRLCGMKRSITLIVVHCTATRADKDFTEQDLLRCHLEQGMQCIGYHFYIRKDGYIHTTRVLDKAGVHARGFNSHSIGIAYEGGLDTQGRPTDTRTQQQKYSMRALIRCLKTDFSIARVCGHRDLSPDLNANGVVEPQEWLKQCPCFDVEGDEWCR